MPAIVEALDEGELGPVTARTLIAKLPEPGRIARRRIVAVAPADRDASCGRRAITGGRTSVRDVLCMAALTVIRHNPASGTAEPPPRPPSLLCASSSPSSTPSSAAAKGR